MAEGVQIFLAKSSDRESLGELRGAQDATLELDLNKSGSGGCWLPSSAKVAHRIALWKTCVLVQKDDEVLWSGPIVNRRVNFTTGRVTIAYQGWFERLMRIQVQDDVTYTDADAGDIGAALLALAQAQDPYMQITLGIVEPTQPRTITYTAGQSIGQAIMEMADLEAGFDWYIDPVDVTLNFVQQRMTDQLNCRWVYLVDDKEHSNIVDLEMFEDGTTVVNDISVSGKFGPIPNQVDLTAQSAMEGVFQDRVSLTDVADDNILLAYAAGELIYRAYPQISYTFSPKPPAYKGAREMFKHYEIGDKTYLTGRRDGYEVNDQAVRVFGASLSIKDRAFLVSNIKTVYSG